jgi:type II secretory pathway pseudopilin PulG
MIVIVILSFAAAGVLSYSLTTYLNSKRQALLDQGKELADSEMENLYYTWKTALLSKIPEANAQNVPPLSTLQASTTPFNHAFQSAVLGNTWSVARSIAFNPIPNTPAGGAQGIVPGTLSIGTNYYYDAKTSASTTSKVLGTITYHSGRHFVFSSTSLFQFAVFYQGNLEIAAGGNMTITGPLSTNASVYMGSQTGYKLTISDSAYYFQDYNGAADPLSGETDRLVGSGSLSDPVYNPNPLAPDPPNQAAQRALQVVKNASQSSFIGGVDVASDIATYPAAYQNLSGLVDPNEVYRAVIAPPPIDTSTGHLIPEDPVVQQSRMYNTAGILITVEQPTAGAPSTNTVIHVGYASSDPNNPTANRDAYTGLFAPYMSTIIPTAAKRVVMNDPREMNASVNDKVNLTTVDVGQLNTALQAVVAANPSTVGANYNGVVYVYDKTNNPAIGDTGSLLNGILLTHGAQTPAFNDQNGNPLGFSVVSNNGVYIQGDYNTTQINVGGTLVNNPAAILGDAITAVSQGWTVTEQNSLTINSRPSNANGSGTIMTINAAILTGNTPSNSAGAVNSGGVQNLVRMIEDWYNPNPPSGLTLTLNGSLGQLFTSKYYTGNYVGNGHQAAINDSVYIQPKTRNFSYDLGLKARQPAGTPTTTNFARGDFYFW